MANAPDRFSVQELLQRGQLWFGKQRSGNQLPESSSPAEHPAHLGAGVGSGFSSNLCAHLSARFGIEEIDRVVSSSSSPSVGLSFGAVHEWCLENQLSCKARYIWYPPSFVICAVLGQTLKQTGAPELLSQKSLIAWVGRRIWPTPEVLRLVAPNSVASSSSQFIFLRPETKDDRLWTIIQLLRSPAVLGVIADGSGLNLAASRRIQLAAQKTGALCFLLRPPWEISNISTAQTKWKISPLPTDKNENYERWNIELFRGRGLPASLEWQLEWKEHDELEQSALALVEKPAASRAGLGELDAARKRG